MANNPLEIQGLEFIEWCGPDSKMLRNLFEGLGFSLAVSHQSREIDLYQQNRIQFILNSEKGSHGDGFQKLHGPSICSMGWRVKDAQRAHDEAVKKGARSAKGDYSWTDGTPVIAIEGIGGSLLYLLDGNRGPDFYTGMEFNDTDNSKAVPDKGFDYIDHLTHNVEKGKMKEWVDFYQDIWGFEEIRYFDIKGSKTGLTSFALRSPCGTFSIPINEGNEEKSQINEYLREYKGAGIQHIALATADICESVAALKDTTIETLDIDATYYEEVFDRVPNVTEDHQRLEDLQILVDGDDEGYLLQIFTKNICGPIFLEIIQRKNHHSFGEGNFGALFRSIERDQEKRGVL